jgi:hypothetical protein
MPIAPGALVLFFRFVFGLLVSIPTARQPALQELNVEFMVQALIWSLVGIFTSVLLRLFVDKRVLFSGQSLRSHIANAGGIESVTPVYKRYQTECRVVTILFVLYLVCAALEAARPGVLAFSGVAIASISVYFFGFFYLSWGWCKG